MQKNKIEIPEIKISVLEKHIWVSSSEYYELLTIKGRYEELKEMIDKIHSMSTPNEVKNIFSSLFKKKEN
jgi:hypothetical protein